MIKVVVTGAGGLLGWHSCALIHAENCAAEFEERPKPYTITSLDRERFSNKSVLEHALSDAEIVLHFAGINRGTDEEVSVGNVDIANKLSRAYESSKSEAHIVYTNSIQAGNGSAYGSSKQHAAEILKTSCRSMTNLVLPHIFGEGARPYYNNVTGTLIDQIHNKAQVEINPNGRVQLLHAGQVARIALDCGNSRTEGDMFPDGVPISVSSLYERLKNFDEQYSRNVVPDLTEQLDLQLFNSFRHAMYPDDWPKNLQVHSDDRGSLCEMIKNHGGQIFYSKTAPSVTRGNHFHLRKVERFLVVEGEAVIRMRKILSTEIFEYKVNGDNPQPVDMPTLYTHSIENIGTKPLMTLFWTNEFFDQNDTDTYADPVIL